ncbi:MAG TPA: hypothetical protein VF017_07000 [Thermoanaerobaculia bacterium]|nr:hypothetical protein [Thermoanaerobaculia bacterium]
MHYETPLLQGPMELYEAPLLVDIDAAGQEVQATGGCSTGGLFDCSPDVVIA